MWERQIFESQKYARDVLGVTATPTFFINDQRLEGNLPFEVLARGLNNMLDDINRGDGNMTHTERNPLPEGGEGLAEGETKARQRYASSHN